MLINGILYDDVAYKNVINIDRCKAVGEVSTPCSEKQEVLSIILALASLGFALLSPTVRNAALYGKKVTTTYADLDLSHKATSDAIHQLALNSIAKPKIALVDLNWRCRETLKFYERKAAGLQEESMYGEEKNFKELEILLKTSHPYSSENQLAQIKRLRAFCAAKTTEELRPRPLGNRDLENDFVKKEQDLDKVKRLILSKADDPARQRELLEMAQKEGYLHHLGDWVNRHFPDLSQNEPLLTSAVATWSPPPIPHFDNDDQEKVFIRDTDDLSLIARYILTKDDDLERQKELLLLAKNEGYPRRLLSEAFFSGSASDKIKGWNRWLDARFPDLAAEVSVKRR